MAEFVGNLTEDIALLSSDDDAPAEHDASQPSSPNGAESIGTQGEQAIQAEENKPQVDDKRLPNNSRLSQNYQPASPEAAAVNSELMEFCNQEIAEALPQWMGNSEKAALGGQVNSGIFRQIANDKSFMAGLNKSYDGTRESVQRGAELLLERWLEELPGAIGNLNLPGPLTQDEADSMDDLEILGSSRHGQPRPARSPLRGVVK